MVPVLVDEQRFADGLLYDSCVLFQLWVFLQDVRTPHICIARHADTFVVRAGEMERHPP